jgi:zinc-finger-containing domain
VRCPYCEQKIQLVTGDTIYPLRPDLHRKLFWQCRPCDAYVGCHESGKGTTPMGSLANAELRKARMEAHAAFDPLWKTQQFESRGRAYSWLSSQLGIHRKKCHISWLSLEDCRRVPALVAARTIHRFDDLEYSERGFA